MYFSQQSLPPQPYSGRSANFVFVIIVRSGISVIIFPDAKCLVSTKCLPLEKRLASLSVFQLLKV